MHLNYIWSNCSLNYVLIVNKIELSCYPFTRFYRTDLIGQITWDFSWFKFKSFFFSKKQTLFFVVSFGQPNEAKKWYIKSVKGLKHYKHCSEVIIYRKVQLGLTLHRPRKSLFTWLCNLTFILQQIQLWVASFANSKTKLITIYCLLSINNKVSLISVYI